MYRFIICSQAEDKEHWYYSLNNKMIPTNWSQHVKEVVLVGYASRQKKAWITSGTPLRIRRDFANIKSEPVTDGELLLIKLKIDNLGLDSDALNWPLW